MLKGSNIHCLDTRASYNVIISISECVYYITHHGNAINGKKLSQKQSQGD